MEDKNAMNRRELAISAAATLLTASAAQAADKIIPINGPRRKAPKGPAKWLYVLLHGFGSNGDDMYSLAPAFQDAVPTAALVAPNAPVSMGDGAYSWLPTTGAQGPFMDGAAMVNAFIDAELMRQGVPPERLLLIGFSQGSSLAINIGIRRPVPPAVVVAYEGARLDMKDLPKGKTKPPMLLVRGTDDDRVQPAMFDATVAALRGIGLPVKTSVLSGLAHNIDGRGIKTATDLIKSVTTV